MDPKMFFLCLSCSKTAAMKTTLIWLQGLHTELTSIRWHVPPSGHHAVLVGHGAAGGQGHRLDEAVEGGGAAQLDQHDVIVQVVAVVVGVLDEPGRVNPLLGALVHRDIVLAEAHLHAAGESERQNDTHGSHKRWAMWDKVRVLIRNHFDIEYWYKNCLETIYVLKYLCTVI